MASAILPDLPHFGPHALALSYRPAHRRPRVLDARAYEGTPDWRRLPREFTTWAHHMPASPVQARLPGAGWIGIA